MLPAAAGDCAPSRRRRHFTQMDDQSVPGPDRAAGLARVPDGAGVLLRERPPRLRREPRALHQGRPPRSRAAEPLLGRIVREDVGAASADRRIRPGLEEMLAAHGLEYFVADAHLISAAHPLSLYRDYLPARGRIDDTP